jgi:molecular chaperone DnaK
MAKIIGIDLGTSNSAAAVVIGGKPTTIPSAEGTTVGGKMFPSYVAFTKEGQVLVGEPARRQAVTNPDRTIMAIKRKMGTDYKVKIDAKSYSPQEISALILQKIKRDAEAFLGEKVEKAVITVPAYFNDNQRQATKDAGQIAGLEVTRIINEPTAAALAYGLDKEQKHELKIAVLDLGGGTFDVTMMEMAQGVFEVKSTSGDTQLGGTDMDNLLVDWVVGEFQKKEGMDLRKDKNALIRVREAAEKAKIELSTVTETTINLPYVTATSEGPKHLEMKLTRAKLESLIDPILGKLVAPMKRALDDAGVKTGQIDKIILVGGPTRMPSVQARFKEFFGREAQRDIDPMECVSHGAAIQAAVISGEVKDILLLDVTPLSLGVETYGGVFHKLIDRNTTIPTKKSEKFTTAADNQSMVEVHVLQGERPMAKDNISLGRFQLVGIPPARRNTPQIEVTFDIDADGLMHVSAKDLGTGNEQKIVITASTKMSKKEVEEAVKKAEQFAEADRSAKEAAEKKNDLEKLSYQAETQLSEMGAKLSDSQKEGIKKRIAESRAAIESNDAAKISEAHDALQKTLWDIAADVYKAGGKPGEPAGETPPPPPPGTYTEGTPSEEAARATEEKDATGIRDESEKAKKGKVVDADYDVVDEK